MTNPLTRRDLESLPAYVPGRTVPGAIKLASNEVPFGPLPGVAEAITAALSGTNRYPDMAATGLRDQLAERLGISAERLVTGCGSVAMTEHLVRATCLPGDEIVYSWRAFEAYPIIAAGAAVRSVQVPNSPLHGHDLKAMASAITSRTRLVIICNPNNPTGTTVSRAELDEFLATVGPDVLVVLDEAYREFVTDSDVPDGIAEYCDRPNVAVLRTFSKAWGLAGLRAGYLVAAPAVAEAVRKVVTPFSTSLVAQAAASAALRASDEMQRRVASVVAERERWLREVASILPGVPASQANFGWLPVGDRALELAQHCEQAKLIVRPFAGEGVRVTFGTREENDRFLAALRQWGA